jgi:uncharacterized membrane protein (DUF485 family)
VHIHYVSNIHLQQYSDVVRVLCILRNSVTRAQLMNILLHLVITIFNLLNFLYVSQAANKLKKYVKCFMLKGRDFRWYAKEKMISEV